MNFAKWPLLLLGFTPVFSAAADTPLIRDLATPFVRPAGVPAASDVTMRTLRFRPIGRDDPHDTFQALDDFHVTRLEWTYFNTKEPDAAGKYEASISEAAKVARVKASGRLFGGGSGSSDGTIVIVDGRPHKIDTVVDLRGQPLVLGHERQWANPPSPGCVNNPEYRRRHLEYLKMYVAAGATSLQRDEAGTQAAFAEGGEGCFCEFCMAGFRDYLRQRVPTAQRKALGVENIDTFDYGAFLRAKAVAPHSDGAGFDWSDPRTIKRAGGPLQQLFVDYQKAATEEFFTWIRAELKAFNHGVPVAYSCNNTSFQNWEDSYVQVFDFANSEMMMTSARPGHIYERAQRAMALGKLQVFGTPKTMGQEVDERQLVALKQHVIATAYAAGSLASVPWDLFLQSQNGKARFFGKPEDFAGLYAMVRASSPWLDGYCTAGAAGADIKDGRYGAAFPVQANGEADLCIFLRAKPKDAAAPVVVHLVNWSERPQTHPVRLSLATAAFFPGRALAVVARTPRAFDPAAHAEAERKAQQARRPGESLSAAQSSIYEGLVDEKVLPTRVEGDRTVVDVPAVTPWTILVVRPVP